MKRRLLANHLPLCAGMLRAMWCVMPDNVSLPLVCARNVAVSFVSIGDLI
jgi:hypothetical protein